MKRENSASSEMSKLLSFGYLDETSPQSAVDNRMSSAGTRHQPSVPAGHRANTTQRSDRLMTTEYQADNRLVAKDLSKNRLAAPPSAAASPAVT